MNNCIITGCGRSGTSMLTGCLFNTGYSIGGHGHHPNISNPKGYFETKEVNGINDQLLKSCKNISYPNGVQTGWLSHKPLSEPIICNPKIRDRMVAVMEKRPFALKDPRFSYTLSVWRENLPVNTKFICIFRHPVAVINSMLNKCRVAYKQSITINETMCFKIWLNMYQHIIIQHAKIGEWLFLHYNQIMFENGLDNLDRFLNTKTDKDFIDQSLLRSMVTGDIPHKLKDMYKTLCNLAEFKGDTNG